MTEQQPEEKQQQSIYAIGIDLGTTNCCVAVYKNERTEIIPNEQGNRTTPSYVAYRAGHETMIGEAAKNQAGRNPHNTIFDAKRLIGRQYNDHAIVCDVKHWPFEVVEMGDNLPKFYIKLEDGDGRAVSPEEISGTLLRRLRKTAEDYLGHAVVDAVITVPAYFNDSQREATKDAGKIAGLNVLRIINEPTAAALAYGLDLDEKEKLVLVFDWGGGTLDCSLLTIGNGIFQVKAISGDTHLGGEDLDQSLMDYCVDMFLKAMYKRPVERKVKEQKLRENQRALMRLRTACERAKKMLTTASVAEIAVEAFYEGEDLIVEMSRAKFENLCSKYFERCKTIINNVLNDAHVQPSDIDEIVLVGGSTRIPKIQQIISGMFHGKELCKNINPDEAVAHGAAIQAAILNVNHFDSVPDVLLLDVVPLTIGVETIGGLMTPLIKRNTTIPINKSKMFSTAADDQSTVTIQIYEGERAQTKYNHLLGTFELSGIMPSPRGVPQINVTFDIDADGILTVTARDLKSGNQKDLMINNDKGRLSQEDIDQIIHQAEEYQKEDEEYRKKVKNKNNLENYLYHLRTVLEADSRVSENIDAKDKENIEELIKQHFDWIEKQTDLDIAKQATAEEYEKKLSAFQDIINPIIDDINKKLKNNVENVKTKTI